MKTYQVVALILTTVACLNLMITGIFNFDIIKTILRNQPIILSFIYTVVGVCGIINLLLLEKK